MCSDGDGEGKVKLADATYRHLALEYETNGILTNMSIQPTRVEVLNHAFGDGMARITYKNIAGDFPGVEFMLTLAVLNAVKGTVCDVGHFHPEEVNSIDDLKDKSSIESMGIDEGGGEPHPRHRTADIDREAHPAPSEKPLPSNEHDYDDKHERSSN